MKCFSLINIFVLFMNDNYKHIICTVYFSYQKRGPYLHRPSLNRSLGFYHLHTQLQIWIGSSQSDSLRPGPQQEVVPPPTTTPNRGVGTPLGTQ